MILLEKLRAELDLDESKQSLKIVDTTRLKCPLPVLLARRAMKMHERITLITTDPASVIDVPVFCAQSGYEVTDRALSETMWKFTITRNCHE